MRGGRRARCRRRRGRDAVRGEAGSVAYQGSARRLLRAAIHRLQAAEIHRISRRTAQDQCRQDPAPRAARRHAEEGRLIRAHRLQPRRLFLVSSGRFAREEGAMTSAKLLVMAAVGLSASACSYSTTSTQAPPPPVAVAPAATTYVVPPPAATTVYTPPARVTYAPAATTPPAGVQAFRDEYGFRYDGQGNRIDARGNI